MYTSKFTGQEIDDRLSSVSMDILGKYDTFTELEQALPTGITEGRGVYLVGTDKPYDFYAWVDDEWVDLGNFIGQ